MLLKRLSRLDRKVRCYLMIRRREKISLFRGNCCCDCREFMDKKFCFVEKNTSFLSSSSFTCCRDDPFRSSSAFFCFTAHDEEVKVDCGCKRSSRTSNKNIIQLKINRTTSPPPSKIRLLEQFLLPENDALPYYSVGDNNRRLPYLRFSVSDQRDILLSYFYAD